MLRNKLFALLIILSMLLSLSSCSNQNAVQKTVQPLSIYVMDYDMYMEEAVKTFNDAQKVQAIEAKTFFSDQHEAFASELQAGLSSGGGPDIIAFPTYIIPNLSKYIKNGSLCDLNTLIADGSGLDLSQYNQQVLDAGVVNGGRYFIPLSYTLDILCTTQDTLENLDVSPDQSFLSLDDLGRMADRISPDSGKFLMDEYDILSSGYGGTLQALYGNTGLDTAGLSTLMDQYKTLSDKLFPASQIAGTAPQDMSRRLKDGEVALLNTQILNFKALPEPYSAFKSEVVPEICAAVPGNGQNEAVARPFQVVAINAHCKDKKKAMAFVSHLLSKDMQAYAYMNGFPVNKAAYDTARETFLKSTPQSGGITQTSSVEKLVQEIDDLMKGELLCALMDNDAAVILYEELEAFRKGGITSLEAAQNMDRRLAEYRDKALDVVKASETLKPVEGENVQKLTIQYMDYDYATKNAIRAFMEKRKDVSIESKTYANSDYDAYVTKLTTAIMAGEGPDILYFNPQIFNSLNKTVATGVFTDLDALIARDNTFKDLDLNANAMKAGIYDGKRYFIPVRYQLPVMVSTQGMLEKNGISIDDKWTLDDLRNIVLDYASATGNRYFFSAQVSFNLLLQSCGMDFIDYDARKSHFQSQEFIELLKVYKDIYPFIMPADDPAMGELPAESMQNNRYVVDVSFSLSPEQLYIWNAIYSEVLGESQVLLPFPTLKPGEGRPIRIMNVAAINETCKNKQAALDFIEELLSLDIQSALDKHGNSNLTLGMPVNREALRKDLEYFTSPSCQVGVLSTGTRSFSPLAIPENLASRFNALNNSISVPVSRDQAIKNMIDEGVQSFIEGKRTAEQAAKDIDDKVNLFLNE